MLIKNNKRGGIGDFISLFFATIVIVVLIVIFLYGSTLIKYVAQQNNGPESKIYISTDDYIDSYKEKISKIDLNNVKNIQSKSVINTRYFPDYVIEYDNDAFEADEFTNQYVKNKCSDYSNYDLIFITGVNDVVDDYSEDDLDDFYEFESQDACFFVLQYLKDEADNQNLYSSITKFDKSVIDSELGVICCYGH